MVDFTVIDDGPQQRSGEMALSGVLRLRFMEQGPEEGPAVLMLHGTGDSSFSFSRVLPLLPPSLRVVAPDQRGHGDSDAPPRSYSIDEFALDGLELLDELHVPRVTIVGHSMGSFIARRIAAFAPERVERLVLIGAGPSGNNAVLRELADAVDALVDPVDPAFVRSFQLGTSSDHLPPEFFEQVITESLKLSARVWKAAIAGLVNYEPVEDHIQCDTLILGGDRDTVFSVAEQHELARRMRGSRLQLFPGAGHALHWEDPAAVVRALLHSPAKSVL
jgi:non-heme chloroperoxidase